MEENEFMEPSFSEIIGLIQQYEEAEKAKQKIFLEEESYEKIVEFYQENREFNKALRVIDAALEQHSFSSLFYTKKAELLANNKKFDEALEVLQAAQTLDPNDINIFLIRADVYLWKGKHGEAMAEVEYALTLANEPEDQCELYLELADIWEDQERYTEVMEYLKKALRCNPKNEEALNRFWFCVELNEKFDESILFHQELIDLSPYSHLAWFNLGHAYAGLGMYEKSLEAFEYVIAIDETFDAAYICSGDVKYNMEQYSDALAFYLEAIRLSKPGKELYLKTAEACEKLEDFTKARTYLRKAIAVDPYYDEAFYKIGETYRIEENWLKAIHSYERAVKLSRENADYLMALAEAYLSAGEGEPAVEIFERIFQLDPETKQNWINLATAYFSVDNFRKAIQVLNEAEQKYEINADIFYIKCVFYMQVGNRHEALINLEKGLLANFDDHIMLFEMDDSLLDDPSVVQVIEQYRS